MLTSSAVPPCLRLEDSEDKDADSSHDKREFSPFSGTSCLKNLENIDATEDLILKDPPACLQVSGVSSAL